MKLITRLAFIAILCFSTVGLAQFVHVDGKEIVDAGGTPILLRGIGLGGWLVPEGYMLHTPGYGSPASIHNQILDVLGEQDTDEFFRIYRANYVNEKDIQEIAKWGFNSIRLPFHYEILSPKDQPGVFLEEGFQIIDSLVTWSKRNGMYVILDMHCAPGGQNPNNISDSDGEAKLWTVPANQDRTVEIWKKIAGRYANETWIAGYDLLNEPVLPPGVTNIDLRNFYRRLALAVREVDTNHILFIEGDVFATEFDDLAPPLLYGTNVAYSFHKYWSETTTAGVQHVLNLQKDWNAALWMGESGENSNTWFYEAIKLFEDNNIGWCWWTHKKIATTTSPLSAPIIPAYQRVLDYLEGRDTKPTQIFARDALFAMARNLAIDKCEPHPDVLHAIFDKDFNTTLKPYAALAIPGTIKCSDYDFGNQGLAYNDADYIRVRWDVDQPWNTGGRLRNDGVDLEASNDGDGAEYSVGWINDGEWIKYTVTVAQAGIYDVEFRVAAPASGGVVQLLLDGQALTANVSIPNTGGWYNWSPVRAQTVNMAAGQHVLTLRFVKAGFNINQMQFILKTPTGVKAPPGGALEDYQLRQNFPNPFGAHRLHLRNHLESTMDTKIQYLLPVDAHVLLTVYNLYGQVVRTLVNDYQDAGKYITSWDGKDGRGNEVGSGVYFYAMEYGTERLVRKLTVLP
jgi:hypothetical protein